MTKSTDPFERAAAAVRAACANMGPTRLRPEAFFVARSGVLTLAYSGFTQAVLDLKTALEAVLPMAPPERPGSRWPKTTLAALRDDEPLSADEIVLLKEATSAAGTCLHRRSEPIEIAQLELVELFDRAMANTGRTAVMELRGTPDSGIVAARNRAAVNAVLAQWRREGLPRYVPDIFRPGHRADHYRSPHHELSLVIRVHRRLPCLDVFRTAIESRLPDRYVWMDRSGLHVTVRTLGDPNLYSPAESPPES